MMNDISLGNIIDSLVPISRFNKGEASKIFDEVRESGCKIVVKNNIPACVLITPEKYQEMVEMMEDQYLIAVSFERAKNNTGVTYSAEDVYAELGVSGDDLDGIEVEID